MKPPPHSVQPPDSWHAHSHEEVLQRMASSQRGLSLEEAERRLAKYGANRLAEVPPRPAWLKFADQFKSMLIVILLITAGLALLIGDVKDMVVILVVIVFNAMLGFYQEHRAEQSLAALKKMLALKARVRRDGHPVGRADQHGADEHGGDPRTCRNAGDRHCWPNRDGPHRSADAGSPARANAAAAPVGPIGQAAWRRATSIRLAS